MTFVFSKELLIKLHVVTPQQNGLVERKHQHILNVARALFFKPIYHTNCGHMQLDIPIILLTKFLPLYYIISLHMKSLASTLQHNRTKFSPRAVRAIFLGHKEGTTGYFYIVYSLIKYLYQKMFCFLNIIFPFNLIQVPLV